ncbi:MAG: AEC family transporter [Bacillota bacterium]|nr:AEC family transporter [Bacillota bacterium]
MHISSVINQMVILFFILLIGYVANRCKVMTDVSNRWLTKLMLNVTVPAMILASVMDTQISMSITDLLVIIAIAFLTSGILLVLGLIVPHLLRVPKGNRGLYTFMTMFGNIAFMGFPVISSIYGDEAIFYSALFMIPFNLLIFSLGVMLIAPKGEAKMDLSFLKSPALIASILSVILFFLPVSVPDVIAETCNLVGDITVPGAMLLIGSTLALLPIRQMFNDWRIYIFSAIRLIALPLIMWVLLHPLVHDPLILGIAVVNSAMPVATNATMFCMEYGGNEKLASKGIFLTTVLSVITIPLIVYILL